MTAQIAVGEQRHNHMGFGELVLKPFGQMGCARQQDADAEALANRHEHLKHARVGQTLGHGRHRGQRIPCPESVVVPIALMSHRNGRGPVPLTRCGELEERLQSGTCAADTGLELALASRPDGEGLRKIGEIGTHAAA